jgi:hypothetical protein
MMRRILQFLKSTGAVIRRFPDLLRWSCLRLPKPFRRRKKNLSQDHLTGSMKKKSMFCSAEAAAISVAFHLLLLLFAGSIVAIRYAQKHDAAFAGENIERPKLERRQLQMPVKVQNLQKKSERPKVTSRMATAASSTFALPDLGGMGLPGQAGGFARVNTEDSSGSRDLSKMGSSGSLGFGVSSVNFFGARSSGEKIVFVLNASKLMMEDRKGGYVTYKFVKERIHQMVSGMQAATLFNVVIYNERNEVAIFSPQLVPASQETKKRLLSWLEPINKDPAKVGQIPVNYKPPVVYESDVANDARNWLKAVQAAMEQGADNIFVLCAGWEWHPVSEARREKLFGWTPEERKKQLEARGWPESRVQDFQKMREDYLAKAREILAKENAARAAKDLPPKVVHDWWNYMMNELEFLPLEVPPDWGDQVVLQWYKVEHVLDYLDDAYQYNYIPKKLEKPKIHFVCLIDADGRSLAEGSLQVSSEGMTLLRKVASQYRGGFEFLRGSKTMEDLLKNNPGVP